MAMKLVKNGDVIKDDTNGQVYLKTGKGFFNLSSMRLAHRERIDYRDCTYITSLRGSGEVWKSILQTNQPKAKKKVKK